MSRKHGGKPALTRLVDLIGKHAEGLERLSRDELRDGRRCVGCREGDGVWCYPVLGWVCGSCDEVLEIVYETEIERTKHAIEQIETAVAAITPA